MADVVENLNTLAKEVFGDEGVPDLIPNMTKVQQLVKFSKADQLGLKFAQTVRLAYPNGFTHAKGDGTAGAFSFNDSIGGTQARAELTGSQVLLRDQMSYEDAAKLTGSKQAFKEGTKYFFEGLQASIRKRMEVEFMYGAQGLSTIASVSGSSTTRTWTLTTAEWASGIWAGNEGMQLDVYNGSSKVNTNAVVTLTSVDSVARTISVSGNATDLTNIIAGYTIYYTGAYANEMTGVHGILSNTGTLFNIDASTYNLWKSVQYAPTSGALSFNKIKRAIALAVDKGLDEDCVLLMNPKTWDDVNADIAALRRTDKSEVKSVEVGHEEIVFYSQNGKCMLVPHIYTKEGYAYGVVPSDWKRIGATDVTFNTPGFGGEMFIHLQTKAGVESRVYTHQAIISLRPGKQFLISNIVNTSI